MRPTWVLVVCSAMTRVVLISVLDRPWAISRSTSVSRWVSAPTVRGNGGPEAWPAGEVGDQPPGHRGGEQGVAGGHHADRVHQFGGGGVLEQEAAGAGPQRLIHVVVEVEGGEHQHPRPGRAGCAAEDLAGRLQPVHDRHPHVHQNDVGQQVPRLADRVRAVGGLAHHLQARLGGEHRGEALPHHRLVVGDQAPRGPAAARRAVRGHGVSPSGSTAETTKPPSGAGPADSEPPSRATRSRIPVSPWPGPCSFPDGPAGPPGPLATRSRTAPASWPTDDGDGGSGGVLAGVGQRFLHDPVGAHAHAGGHPAQRGGC